MIQIHSKLFILSKILSIIISIICISFLTIFLLFEPSLWIFIVYLCISSIILGFVINFWLKLSKVFYDPIEKIIYCEPEKRKIPLSAIYQIRTSPFDGISIFPISFIDYKLENGKTESIAFLSKKRILKSKKGDEIQSYFEDK